MSNIVPAYPAKRLNIMPSPMGGWIFSMAKSLLNVDEKLLLGVVSIGNVPSLYFCEEGRIRYYVLPISSKPRERRENWEKVLTVFEPDIVHLQGTEFDAAYYLLERKHTYTTIASIQGLVGEYAKYYYGGISPYDRIVNTTLRDLVRSTMRQEKKNFESRGRIEAKMLQMVDYIIGRTDWDKSACYKLGVIKRYRKCNENLRDIFYPQQWQYAMCKPRSIFLSQAAVPYKGAHMLLEALKIVKRDFPDVSVRIAGYDILATTKGKDRFRQHGYTKYFARLIKKYDLTEQVKFTGLLNETEMAQEYLSANCFIQTSAIENSPNSLGEAMLLGMPVIASFVGGTGDFLHHKENGLLYPFNDTNLLAYYIEQIFTDIDFCTRLGVTARKYAQEYYDRANNARTMISIYQEAINCR